jgi:hypothetical protein
MADLFPKLWWSNGEIIEYIHEVSEAFRTFDSDILKQPRILTVNEYDIYISLHTRYRLWVQDLGPWGWNSGSSVKVAEQYAKQLKYWRDIFNSRTSVQATGPGVDLLVTSDKFQPVFSANLLDKESGEKIQVLVVAVCVAVGLSAIARTIRG